MRFSESDASDVSRSQRESRSFTPSDLTHQRKSESNYSDITFDTSFFSEGGLKHPAEHWNNRAQELDRVLQSGKPCSAPVVKGDVWYIIDATWFLHWLKFVTSSRRMAPPGVINNSWMINPQTNAPFRDLREDTDQTKGDFRRVTPAIWEIFMQIYGGGPAIWVDGPPLEKVKRWRVHGLDANLGSNPPSVLSQLFSSSQATTSKPKEVQSTTDTSHQRSQSTARSTSSLRQIGRAHV